ncbi:MAG TPA: putative DNA-binding domain-containing protein [Myxococcota bacterium]|nr:putative DNA-binding domain-containing protein [Myxococcota bacterium]
MAALGETQRWLARLITAPEGVGAALAAEGEGAPTRLAALVRADRGLAAEERLDVYAHAYTARIEEVLREDFGALAAALGAEAFHDLVLTYLMANPPFRPSLREAGARLAEHLATEPFAGIFGRRCAHAADLARLEWAMAEAFYAEDAPVLAREALGDVAPDAFASLRFETSPSLRLLDCAWPVHRTRAAFDAGEPAPSLAAEGAALAVWRHEERVRYRALAPLEAAALGAARAGATFGAICARIAEDEAADEVPARAAGFLATWLRAGLLARAAG